MKQIHIRSGTIFQILRFLYRIAKRWGSGGMPTQVKSGCGSQHSHRLRLRLAGRGPNNSSLHPPLAAVAVVAGHSIARPIACGNRVPPQRTVLRETPDVSDCGFVSGILSQLFKAEAGIKVHPFRRTEKEGLQALR